MLRLNLSFPCQLKQAAPRKDSLWRALRLPLAGIGLAAVAGLLQVWLTPSPWSAVLGLVQGCELGRQFGTYARLDRRRREAP